MKRHASSHATGTPRIGGSARTGFTIVELVVVIALLLLGLLSLASTGLAVHGLTESDESQQRANAALESIVEEVKAISNSRLEAAPDWSTAVAAALAPGGVPGNQIAIPGLQPPGGFATVCTVNVVTDETLTDAELGVNLGMPRDLDNDGAIDNDDVTGTAVLLPVVVTMRWTTTTGDRQIVQGFHVLGY